MFDVTLTFDNGPEPEVTPRVLETLRRTGVSATFFVIGQKLVAHRALAERAAAEGHWIGNHTFTHSIPLGERVEADAPEMEIGRTQAIIGDLAGAERLFRPNGGGGKLGPHLLSPAAADYLKHGGFTCVLWNCVPEDWLDPEGWADRALQDCRSRDWTLLVVHDLPTGAMAHLDRFIHGVRDAGGRFRQDFPPDCLPLRGGRETESLGSFVAS
ncbi:MAG TPA: polysaccharide deacetylase family protein [Aliidongia sp.]|nr:polysaccharide deacetylase family protein [Aliidongia sp.]